MSLRPRPSKGRNVRPGTRWRTLRSSAGQKRLPRRSSVRASRRTASCRGSSTTPRTALRCRKPIHRGGLPPPRSQPLLSSSPQRKRRASRGRPYRSQRGRSLALVVDGLTIRDARDEDLDAVSALLVAAYAQYMPRNAEGMTAEERSGWEGYRRNIADVWSRASISSTIVAERDGELL